MTTENTSRIYSINYGPNFWLVVLLGGLIGYLLAGNVLHAPVLSLVAPACLGLIWSYLILQWLDLLSKFLSFNKDPVPSSLLMADRNAVKEHLGTLSGRSSLTIRCRHLLEAWTLGWNPRQVIELAASQSAQAGRALRSGVVFVLLLVLVSLVLNENLWLTWGSIVVLAVTVLARQTLLNRVDAYIETRLLTRLPANIPQTAMTAAELAEALGGAINQAFKNHVPQPEQSAQAMKSAVESIVKNVATEVEKVEKALADSQKALVDKWKAAAEATTSDLKDTQKMLSTTVNDLTGGFSSHADKFNKMIAGHTAEMDKIFGKMASSLKDSMGASTDKLQAGLSEQVQKLDKSVADMVSHTDKASSHNLEKLTAALNQHVEQIGKAGGTWSGQLKDVLAEHSSKLQAASQAIAGQLEKIMTLEKDIQKVLHIQEVVDGTLKTVTTTDEFKQALTTLRTHLQESDKLLREVSKPRTIRLVEAEGEVEQR